MKNSTLTLKWLICYASRSQWQRSLRLCSAAVRMLGLWVRIASGAWMSASRECCVLSGRGLCVGLVTRPEESCRVWCVWVWSWSLDNEEALANQGLLRHWKKIFYVKNKHCTETHIGCTKTHFQLVTQYLLCTAITCFGHRTWPSWGSYKLLRRTQHIL
jgi:hypothetical protein